ncbi:hypothetical protein SEVIR_7G317400v4 [Setaria viridis]|uniref:V-type proton ATPase subunit S1/VOA1 transmembrane domain-containing protein n=3 Tax=Setaria TaxID=4554 RepID=A0A368S1I8_SETIT|nr:uncharacterized protein LOC101753191 [Setaria italica]XP_034603332.1 uncharacterized protein LOC117863639 [Setaria viridis]RCV36286.1 hypothetical protein SETIT_7G306600v2 [Setaria italica]TKW07595.1 hypothetical protein SEVIR_7G317400v2 [Setaria viridis]
MAAAWAVLAVLLVAAQVSSAAPVLAPAFLWAPKNYGFRSDATKEIVHYQTVSPKSLAKSVLEEGGWSNFICSREDAQKNVDVAVVFIGSKLQSSDISKDKQVDPALADTLKLSFTSSDFSIAFPYVSTSDDEKLENSLLSGFAENCNNGFERNHITYTDTCTVGGQDLEKYTNMDAINDLVRYRKISTDGQTDLIIFCSGGFQNLDPAKSEGELLSALVYMLKDLGVKYTILYASQPSGLLENPSREPLGRHLAEKTNTTTKAGLSKCDGECLVKSTLLEGTFVGIVLLIILISGLMCMMGIDTPLRFEAPQES